MAESLSVQRESILLVRMDGIGDAALSIPALAGLDAAFPTATFGAVCSRANAPLFSDKIGHIYVHEGRESVPELAAQLRAHGYTRAMIATEEVDGYRLAKLSRIPMRAGFWHGVQKPFKSVWQHLQLTHAVFRPAAWSPAPVHEAQALFGLAQALGARQPAPADANVLRSWLNIARVDDNSRAARTIGFQITPKLLTAGWGLNAIAEVIMELFTTLHFERCYLISAPQDEGLACSVMEQVAPGLRTDGRITVKAHLDVPHWIGMLDSVSLVITPDTGAAHVAGMLGVPVIDIFDSPDFERLERQWRPWAAPSRCIYKPRFREGAARKLGQEIAAAASQFESTLAGVSANE